MKQHYTVDRERERNVKWRRRERGGKVKPLNTGNVQSSSKSFYSFNAAFYSQTQMFLFPKEGIP